MLIYYIQREENPIIQSYQLENELDKSCFHRASKEPHYHLHNQSYKSALLIDKSKNQRKLLTNQAFKSKPKKLVISIISGPGVKELEYTTQPLFRTTSFTSPTVFPTPTRS